MKKAIKFFILLIVFMLAFQVIFSNENNQVSAISGADFMPGRIIDDGVFFNPNSVSAQDIQAFLNSKVPVCDTWHTAAGGYNPPFTCLKDYSQNTPTKLADSYCSGNYFGGVKTSSQIIKDVSTACNINPRVLVVLLQKEQSLVTDTWPWPNQYDHATGFACPDTSGCDPAYAGFFYQVYYAARQYQRYAKQSSIFNYKAGQTNYILYNPNSNCGGTNVYIQNQATAGLYNYTPYQPNAAALANLYGTGDSCSAYGNRNFWRLFNDWFGTTYSGTAAQEYFSLPHPTGAIIRQVNGGPIYKMIDGYKAIIPNYTVFRSLNYHDSQVKILNSGEKSVPESVKKIGYRSGTLVREISNPKIYVIECSTQFYDSCTKRHINSYETFLYLGYDVSRDVLVIPNGELNDVPSGSVISGNPSHPNGTLIIEALTNKIYLIKNGSKYHVPSAYLFLINRYDWSKVRLMNSSDSSIPTGNGYPAYDSNLLVRPFGDVKIYAIGENGFGTTYKRHISSYDTFLNLGYSDRDVLPLEKSLTDSYVSIPPYPF